MDFNPFTLLSRHTNLKQRLTLLFFFITLFSASIIGWLGFRSTSSAYREKILQTDHTIVKDHVLRMEAFFSDRVADLRFLADFHALHRFAQWRDVGEVREASNWRLTTLNAFHSFARSKKIYSQVRLIDDSGMEILRINHDRNTDRTFTTPTDELQDKGHRSYYRAGMRLKPGEIHITPMELSVENNRLIIPHLPTIRYVAPIFGEERIAMLLVLNVYADHILDIVETEAQGSRTMYLVDHSGFYLFHPDRERRWGAQLDHGASLHRDDAALFTILEEQNGGVDVSDNYISTFQRILPLSGKPGQYWHLVNRSEKSVVLARLNQFKYLFIAVLLIIFFLTSYLAARFTGGILKPLAFVTGQLKQLSKGEIPRETIAYDTKDEIGDMLGSSEKLITNIKSTIKQANAIASGDYSRDLTPFSEKDRLGIAISKMTVNLRSFAEQSRHQDWLKTGLNLLNKEITGVKNYRMFSDRILGFIIPYVESKMGAFYLLAKKEGGDELVLFDSYAYRFRKNTATGFSLGEGLVGQCGKEQKPFVLTDVPDDYIRVSSGLGERAPTQIYLMPLTFERQLLGVIEIAGFAEFTGLKEEFLAKAAPVIGAVLFNIKVDIETQGLLDEVNRKNTVLEEQTTELENQRRDLQESNLELASKTRELESARIRIDARNKELELTQAELNERAEQLEITNRYKSEFLANMSHELRTPLNSILILSKMLSKGDSGNVSKKQVEQLRTIHEAGSDLLNLINEVLDLAKIESGKMAAVFEEMDLAELCGSIRLNFEPLAEERKIGLSVTCDPGLKTVVSDEKLVKQVLRNLLSNAVKFTRKGEVTVHLFPDHGDPGNFHIRVKDTGIGIPAEKQRLIFEAFQQVDGSISREFGGTGLGLSISRELVRILGGRISLESEEGKGSSFTVTLPRSPAKTISPSEGSPREGWGSESLPVISIPTAVDGAGIQEEKETERIAVAVKGAGPEKPGDDSATITPGDNVILLIEDDRRFALAVKELVNRKGFKMLLAENGLDGMTMAKKHLPDGILLDIQLPLMDGWQVITALKANPETRHIPVNMVSVVDAPEKGYSMGAFMYMVKPVSMEKMASALTILEHYVKKPLKELLIVEDDPFMQRTLADLFSSEELFITTVDRGRDAIDAIGRHDFDCIILDLKLKDQVSGMEVLKFLREETEARHRHIPVIVYTSMDLTAKEEAWLKSHSERLIIKGAVTSDDLLAETSLFLHQIEKRKRERGPGRYEPGPLLNGNNQGGGIDTDEMSDAISEGAAVDVGSRAGNGELDAGGGIAATLDGEPMEAGSPGVGKGETGGLDDGDMSCGRLDGASLVVGSRGVGEGEIGRQDAGGAGAASIGKKTVGSGAPGRNSGEQDTGVLDVAGAGDGSIGSDAVDAVSRSRGAGVTGEPDARVVRDTGVGDEDGLQGEDRPATVGERELSESGKKGEIGAVGPGTEKGAPADSPVVVESIEPVDLSGKTVLLVDDDFRNSYVLSIALEKYGLDIIMAENGKEALEVLENESVDLVLMDIMMPIMDGWEATRAIRSRDGIRDLPVIAVTAKAMEEDRKKCFDAGVSDYITKPVDVEELSIMMMTWLNKAGASS